MEDTKCLTLAGWLGSDQWQLGLESLKSKARAHCHLLHSCAVLSPSPRVQALTLKDHPLEQNITLLPNNTSKTISSLKSKSKSGRGAGEKTRWHNGLSARRPVWEGSQRGEFLREFNWEERTKHSKPCLWVNVCVTCTFSSSDRQGVTLCSSLTMVMKSLSWRSSSLVLHRDKGWYCKKKKKVTEKIRL